MEPKNQQFQKTFGAAGCLFLVNFSSDLPGIPRSKDNPNMLDVRAAGFLVVWYADILSD